MAIITPGNAAEVSALAEWQVADVVDMDWVPDGNGLAIATSERIDLFDLYSREKLRSLYPQSTRLVSIDFSSDFFGKWLVAGSRWGSESEGFGSAIELWRGPDWQPRGILSGSTRALSQVEFSPNGRALAAVYSSPVEQENVIEFINTTQWTISSTLATGSVLGVNFSPDSTFLATSPNRYSVHIWEINPKTLAFRFLTAFTDAVNTMAYSPDGLILATGSYDGSLRLWDMQTGVLIQSIPTDAVIESLAFSPDGSLIATGGGFQDNLVRIWSVETKELLRELEGHTQGVNRVLFSPDGQFLVSGSYDGKVMLWGIRP
jgi:WD40 repeat protein